MRGAIAAAAETLAAAGVPSPRYDAEALVAHVLGVARADLVWREVLDSGEEAVFHALVTRRARREPLQHITGRAYFRHVVLAVGPGVFVPRPETEVVAGWAIDAACRAAGRTGRGPVVVDLGTGSGAIAMSVAQEVPEAAVWAVELDAAALAWAQRNLAATGVRLVRGDLGDCLPELDGTVDVVVSNPPYIPDGASIRDPEVAAHDPAGALWSGPDGLAAIRAVERTAARLLRPAGTVVVEHADRQGESAPELFRAAGGWLFVTDHEDLTGRPRFVTAERAG